MGPEDDYRTVFPRAYVIPAGARQRSEAAASRLVDLLIGSGGRVWRAARPFQGYPAGSYVIDLHQPKRGIVNALLEPGADITDRVSDLYAGPAAWSQGLTWGATVDTLWSTLPRVPLQRVHDGAHRGSYPPGRVDYRLDPRDATDLRAVNQLLAGGAQVHRLADGALVVPAKHRRLVAAAVRAFGVTFDRAPRRWQGTLLDEVVVGYVGSVEARDTLADTGFPARAVTPAALAATLTADIDVLLVAGTLNPATLTAENRAALDAFLARGGGVVGLDTAGPAFSTAAGLLGATAHSARAWPAAW